MLCCHESEFSLSRRLIGKILPLWGIIDDTHDAYGTPEELDLFNKAITRWDENGMDELPNYMKIAYKALWDAFVEVEEELVRKGWSYRVHYPVEEVW